MINKAIIQGRLVRDPEIRHTQNNKSVCTFTVAWSTRIGDRENKLFLRCTAWNKSADMVNKYFRKGQEIIVCGRIETVQWKDKDGNDRQNIQMTVNEVNFCGTKQNTESSDYNDTERQSNEFTEIDEDSELPF